MAAHTSNDSSNSNETRAMSSNEFKRITSQSWVQEYKNEFRGTPTVPVANDVFSDDTVGDARIPSMDPALRIGSNSFARYRSDMSATIANEERVSTQEFITSSLWDHEMDTNRISTGDYITTLLGGDVLTEVPHLSLEKEAENQAVEPSTLLPAAREYVDAVGEWDSLCERGGKANHYSGNKRYRKVVSQMRAMYRETADKSAKTDLSKYIMEYVSNYGARFLKKDKEGRYFVMTKAEARKKTSQALRETKLLKWTDVDVEDDAKLKRELFISSRKRNTNRKIDT